MINAIQFERYSQEELKNFLINIHEKYWVELKNSSDLPASFWETYSSICNTAGGIIILGVEEGHPHNIIKGVNNPEKVLTDLWNNVSNPSKVNYRNINNQDVHTYTIDGKTIIIVCMKEAPESMKPIYTNGKYENTWIRTGDGDRKATKEELAAMMRNAQPGQDSLPADGFTMDDLDPNSVLSFKERVNLRFPKKHYLEMDNAEFLVEIGACTRVRATNEVKIKRGTLLFLGKVNSIKELFPHYHVDFFNRRGNNPRWSDRVSDDEPSDDEMNLFNFYRIVYEKMRILLQEGFHLDGEQLRIPISTFDETIRECLINCLAHADYILSYPSTKIDVYDGWFRFTNPGKMLVTPQQFWLGGDSRPRNEIIMKLFRLLGISERQGFGGPLIYKTAMQNEYRRPEIISDIERTEIKVWNIDLADSYPDLAADAKSVLRYLAKEDRAQSIKSIREALGITDYATRKAVQSLEEPRLIRKIGSGPSTAYTLAVGSIELFTKLQVRMEDLKKQMQ
jgi:predicted HTH transcriptional regulator